MDIERLLKIKVEDEREKVEMILSNRLDVWFEDRACISSKNWSELACDLIKWKNTYYPTTTNVRLRYRFAQIMLRITSYIRKRCLK